VRAQDRVERPVVGEAHGPGSARLGADGPGLDDALDCRVRLPPDAVGHGRAGHSCQGLDHRGSRRRDPG
jgi:hypothetical protein